MQVINKKHNRGNKMKNTIKGTPLFATPDSMDGLMDYIEKFSGGEKIAAMTCAMLAWNLACALVNDEPNPEIQLNVDDSTGGIK
jgi:hypothetical protein